MKRYELSEPEREQMIENTLRKEGIRRWRPTREELEREIIDYLSKKHPCCLATCGKDGVPRISVVEYVNDGLTIYIASEGGKKFRNLKENNRVAVGIGNSARTYKSERGVNISGIAVIFDQDSEEFLNALKLFIPMFKQFGIGAPQDNMKNRDYIVRMICITPTEIVYNHTYKGIINEHWYS
ncbi:MAG: pyridoxamine 5'-phosphate oxidase family protein [Deltaproteobacteria bacterium]|nr:pyridoxamine 5'-phosphate oxidase family protein [Deltaproteobacteria bacterium]